MNSVPGLMSGKHRVFKMLNEQYGQYIPKSSLTLDLKINTRNLLLMMYQCMEFDVCLAMGLADINRQCFPMTGMGLEL